jgi:hypothetical protein
MEGRAGRSDFSYRDPSVGAATEVYYKIGCLETGSGAWSYSAPVRAVMPAGVFAFLGARPNPGRGGVQRLMFELGRSGRARLEVYDAAGRRVRRVADGFFGAGVRAVEWDGRGEDGRAVASGVYWVRLECAGHVKSGKLVVAR